MSYRPLYRAVYARSLLFANEMVNLIAHYIGLSTYTAVNSKNVNIFLIAHYIGLSTRNETHENPIWGILIAHYIGLSTLHAKSVLEKAGVSYRPLYRAVYKSFCKRGILSIWYLSPIISGCLRLSVTNVKDKSNLIAHYIGLSTLPDSLIYDIDKKTYRPLYRAVYNNI